MSELDALIRHIRERFDYNAETGDLIWRSSGRRVGCKSDTGYLRAVFLGKRYRVHRIVWLYVHGRWPIDQIDHVNCDKADNRLANLRECDSTLNAANRRRRKNSHLKGVHFSRGRWVAMISINRKNVYLGRFDTAEEAHAAWLDKAKSVFGEFARAA